MPHYGFDLHSPPDEWCAAFLHSCWPFLSTLKKNLFRSLAWFFVCLLVLSSFESFVFFCLVVWVSYVFCILTPYKIQDLQMPSPILKAAFLHFIIWCVHVPWRTCSGQRTTQGNWFLLLGGRYWDWTQVTLEQAPKASLLYIILLFPCGILWAPCYPTCLLFHLLSLLWDSYPQSLPRPESNSLSLCFPPDPQCQALINWKLVFMCDLGV